MSQRLPYTIAKSFQDYSSDIIISPATVAHPQHDYDDGVFVDYRSFLAKGIAPRYAFGYGLSYTTFAYSALSVSELSCSNADKVEQAMYAKVKAGTLVGASSLASLHRDTIQVCSLRSFLRSARAKLSYLSHLDQVRPYQHGKGQFLVTLIPLVRSPPTS